MTSERGTVLVTGATGNIGRHVVRGLLAAGVAVRAVVRDPEAADLPDGAEVVRGDLTRPEELVGALAGIDTVFLLWPFPTAEGAATVLEVIAAYAGHVVYVSSMSVRDDQEPAANGVWGEVEHLIEKSGLAWTFLRPGGFATNTLEWAGQIRADGTVRWVYGGAGRSLIHERDIAEVAVRALTDPGHIGARYVLTGPEVLTQEEQVRIIGEVIGRPARWVEIPVAQARQILVDGWAGAGLVDGALGYWARLVTDPEPVTRTVEEVTGVPARTFRNWAADHADEFRPSRPEGGE
ncbi:NAD(P)H-binding protein [Plantactinospora sp. S1510]|uniref:NAD(P)H-binding protein n=1 Tax=Plantactinospora alkalitolerans TaxID=2789879 RepID=A0ABS0GN16_9ACTN|nr:NAD(P)H-binding protein [Plantactinospora alkalitolerans]MBF9127567.1 NAD(P)H-binding protein [Plantactinospora alkalitolerans]